jgi:probable rRNA maturation factor
MTVTVCNRQRLRRVDTRRLRATAGIALKTVGADDEQQLNIVLVRDALIAKLNRQFHHREGPTDILTFDYGSGIGELIISVEHAISQAARFRSTPSRELALYVIHGVLHLHGYDDLAPRPRVRMRAAEQKLLAIVAKSPGYRNLLSTRRNRASS